MAITGLNRAAAIDILHRSSGVCPTWRPSRCPASATRLQPKSSRRQVTGRHQLTVIVLKSYTDRYPANLAGMGWYGRTLTPKPQVAQCNVRRLENAHNIRPAGKHERWHP